MCFTSVLAGGVPAASTLCRRQDSHFHGAQSFVFTELMFLIRLLQLITRACVKENNPVSLIIIFRIQDTASILFCFFKCVAAFCSSYYSFNKQNTKTILLYLSWPGTRDPGLTYFSICLIFSVCSLLLFSLLFCPVSQCVLPDVLGHLRNRDPEVFLCWRQPQLYGVIFVPLF